MSNDLPEQSPAPPHPEHPDREEVEKALQERSEAIAGHLNALERELGTTGTAIKEVIARRPWLALGGALAAGLGVGWFIQHRRRKRDLPSAQRLLVELYMDAVADEVKYQMRKGKDPEEAVYAALQDRVPLVYYDEKVPGEDEGALRQGMDLVIKTALGFAVKIGLDYLTTQVGLDEFEAPAESGNGTDVTTVAAAASEETASAG